MDQLIILLKAGIPLKSALKILTRHSHHQSIQNFADDLDQGRSLVSAARHFFQWWCPYPFGDVQLPIDALGFLTTCQSYIKYRQSFFRFALQQLVYPTFLIVMALFLFVGLVHHFQHLSSSSIALLIGGVFLMLFFCLMAYFFYIIFQLFQCSILDLLILIEYSIRLGWPLDIIFDSFQFSGRFQLTWNEVKYQSIYLCSFVDALQLIYKLPIQFYHIFLMHEKSGQLLKGLELIIPPLTDVKMQQFKQACRSIAIGFYILLICLIFGIIFFVYLPLMTHYLR
tara:strand:- start:1728 stop:2576 length:849 start_codon:yes stop_codon:yes gene_type:complete